MAAQPLPLSPEEFHRLYDGAKPAYDYWYGAAVQKSMPAVLHGIVQAILVMLLEKAGWNTASEVRLKVVPDAEPVPDAIAVRGKFKGLYPTAAPELCIEIMSPRDTLAKALEKANKYISWGSECVWIIDPEKRTAWTLSSAKGAAARRQTGEELARPSGGALDTGHVLREFLQREDALGPTFSPSGSLRTGETAINLPTLFAEVDRKLEMTDQD